MASLTDTTNKKLYDAIMSTSWVADLTKRMESASELRNLITNLLIEAPQALEGIAKTDLLTADFNRIYAMMQGKAVWYSINELSALWGKHRISIYRYIKSGKLKGQKIGDEWRVTQDAVDEFIRGGGK
jgi:excisionase family DNA binding protein